MDKDIKEIRLMLKDIYFEETYGKLCEYIEDGSACKFVHQDDNGRVSNLFIKREIPIKIEGKTYYDITTPYGYGGPLIEELKGDVDILVNNYMKEFTSFCKRENIVSEFIRFHPIIGNHKDFGEVYQVKYLRDTVATHIVEGEDPLYDEFSKSARKTIRKALKEDLHYEVIREPENLEAFKKVYYDTMDRNDAESFYYFTEDYFDYMIENMKENILNINIYSGDICIASGLYFIYGSIMQAHLSGTRSEYLYMSPAYVLKYLTSKWAKENSLSYIHYGGGTSNSEEDSLLKFKEKFTKRENYKFYIGKKIYNKEIYDLLVEKTASGDSDFFPQYRRR